MGGIGLFIHYVLDVDVQAPVVGNEVIRTKAKTTFSRGLNLMIRTAPQNLMPRFSLPLNTKIFYLRRVRTARQHIVEDD